MLNIRRHRGAAVEGFLFAVAPEGWAALDKKEGHPHAYRREKAIVLDPEGREVRGQTYRAPEGEFVCPAEEYLDICRRGREQHDLEDAELDLAAANEIRSACDSVFVYGTLMRGEENAAVWRGLELGCALLAQARGALRDHGAYPGMVLGQDGEVEGEFLRFGKIGEALEPFDRLEGFFGFGAEGNVYRRTLSTFHVGDGRARRAWTYVTMQADAPAIESGDWRAHCGRRREARAAIVAAHAARQPDFLGCLARVPDNVPLRARGQAAVRLRLRRHVVEPRTKRLSGLDS